MSLQRNWFQLNEDIWRYFASNLRRSHFTYHIFLPQALDCNCQCWIVIVSSILGVHLITVQSSIVDVKTLSEREPIQCSSRAFND